MLNDLSAFERLYETHGPRMKSLAYNMLRNVSDAEDAVQEAFLKAYRSRGRFLGQASPGTWLYRILVNVCYDLGRKRATRGREDAWGDLATEVSSSESDHPLRLTLEDAVRRLPRRQLDVFLLHEVEGFTHQEIAEILAIREGTSKATLFAAKRELRALIKPLRSPLEAR